MTDEISRIDSEAHITGEIKVFARILEMLFASDRVPEELKRQIFGPAHELLELNAVRQIKE